MKKNYQNRTNRIIVSLFLSVALSLIFSEKMYAETFVVSGKVSTYAMAVQSASVSFIDNSDTTRKFTTTTDMQGNYQIDVLTSINETPTGNQPHGFSLEQNYPNPFSSSTAILYKLNTPSDVKVAIYDVLGRQIRKFEAGVQMGGTHGVVWDGKNNLGQRVAAGIYFYRLQVGDKTQVKKMMYDGGKGNFIFSLPKISPSSTSNMKKDFNVNLFSGNFTVRIENTVNTIPEINPKQINNIVIQNDTTANFSVESAIPGLAAVFPDSSRQVISGFGAANILPWRPDMTSSEIDKAFGAGPGQIGFTILRLRVPWNSNEFGINVSTAQAAHSMGVKIIASPWTPPPDMKTNNNIVGGRLKEESYADFAGHLKSFADFMSNNGVPLYAISVQNEPDVSVTYESCDYNASEMLRFMKENAPAVGADVFAPESFHFDHSLSDSLLYDSTAASHTAFIGGHIYGGGLTSYPLAAEKGKELWMTEYLDTDTSWTHVLATGKEINDCMNVGMSAYIWWYIVRFYGPILEDGNVSKRGYVMSQFARFIRPGYYRVDATANPQASVYLSAYTGSSKTIIVAINYRYQPTDQTFLIPNGTATSFTPYVTSDNKNCVQENDIAVSTNMFTATLDARSVTTFISE